MKDASLELDCWRLERVIPGESNQEGVDASLIGGVRGALNLDVPPGDFIRAEHFLQLASIKHGKCGQEGSKNLQKINLACNDQF